MPRRWIAAGFALSLTSLAFGAGDFAAAKKLFEAKRYPEARPILEQVVAAEPKNAAAWHLLGLTWKGRGDTPAIEQALKALAKAVELEPANAVYLGDFGGTELELASRATSYSAATKGRDAMEKAIAIDPGYLDAREGLFQFYRQAPWPIGSKAKAEVQLEEIRRRDPERATRLSVLAKTDAKDFAAAFALCDQILAKSPDDFVALYYYGRTASASGQNLERGLEALQKCLTLPSPTNPTAPTLSNVWNRIGVVQEKLNHPAEARAAYQQSLKLDPNNRQAAAALAKLR